MKMTCEILTANFSPERRLAWFRKQGGDYGAIAAFIGSVRSNRSRLRFLLIEAYLKMANRQLRELARRTLAEFAIGRLLIIHRIGKLKPSQPIVLVAAAAKHRAQASAACKSVVEALKSDIALWKCEIAIDGSRRWIEPPNRG